MASGNFRRVDWLGILAAASSEAVRNPAPMDWQSTALGGRRCCRGNDFVSPANCWIPRQRFGAVCKMKKKLIVAAVAVMVVVLGTVYLWMPGKVPADQQSLVTLSSSNIGQFESNFDSGTNVPRLILLFSPT